MASENQSWEEKIPTDVGEIALRFTGFWDHKHANVGKGGPLNLEDHPQRVMPMDTTAGDILMLYSRIHRKNHQHAAATVWRKRQDGSIRFSAPWLTIRSTDDPTPLREWLARWLHRGPLNADGLPLVNVCLHTNLHIA